VPGILYRATRRTLSAFRPSRSSSLSYVLAQRRCSLRFLLRPHWSPLLPQWLYRTLEAFQCTAGHRFQTFFPMGVPLLRWKLEFKQFGLHHIERALRCNLLQRLGLFSALMPCCCPLRLSTSGKALAQGYSIESFSSATRIRYCAQRRTPAGQGTAGRC
jgi:hypothetical protein